MSSSVEVLELRCKGPQCLRIFLSGRAGTSTALATVVQLLEKQSCEHHCNPAAHNQPSLPLPCSLVAAEQGQRLHYWFPAPPRPWALYLPTYLCCNPLPGLQVAGSSRTKHSMVMWSARTLMSMSLQPFAL